VDGQRRLAPEAAAGEASVTLTDDWRAGVHAFLDELLSSRAQSRAFDPMRRWELKAMWLSTDAVYKGGANPGLFHGPSRGKKAAG
jgi:hypothetical protein